MNPLNFHLVTKRQHHLRRAYSPPWRYYRPPSNYCQRAVIVPAETLETLLQKKRREKYRKLTNRQIVSSLDTARIEMVSVVKERMEKYFDSICTKDVYETVPGWEMMLICGNEKTTRAILTVVLDNLTMVLPPKELSLIVFDFLLPDCHRYPPHQLCVGGGFSKQPRRSYEPMNDITCSSCEATDRTYLSHQKCVDGYISKKLMFLT